MKPTLFVILPFALMLLSSNCRKKHDVDCGGQILLSGQFYIKEIIGDTAFVADTAFRNNYIQFQAKDKYESVEWKLGTDPRSWADSSFSLSFITALGQIPITFTGHQTPNTACFPNDNGVYSSTKNLTLVEQVQKPLLTLSRLIGKYKGYFIDAPADTFTVRMEYFDSAKYDVSITGSKNFYWFSNMPNGFTTTLGIPYAELQHGHSVEMGYKSFIYSYDSQHTGKAWSSNDTLYIITGTAVVGRRKFIGKKL